MAEDYDRELLRNLLDEVLRENSSATLLELAQMVSARLEQLRTAEALKAVPIRKEGE